MKYKLFGMMLFTMIFGFTLSVSAQGSTEVRDSGGGGGVRETKESASQSVDKPLIDRVKSAVKDAAKDITVGIVIEKIAGKTVGIVVDLLTTIETSRDADKPPRPQPDPKPKKDPSERDNRALNN